MLWNFIFSMFSFKITARHSEGEFRCTWLWAALAGMGVSSFTTIFAHVGLRVGGTWGGLLFVCSAFLSAMLLLSCTLLRVPGYEMRSMSGFFRCVPIYWLCMFITALLNVLLNVWPLLFIGGSSGVGLGYSRVMGF